MKILTCMLRNDANPQAAYDEQCIEGHVLVEGICFHVGCSSYGTNLQGWCKICGHMFSLHSKTLTKITCSFSNCKCPKIESAE